MTNVGAENRLVEIDDCALEVARWPGPTNRPPIVLLHHGFGSVAGWADFPERLRNATHREVIAYSRADCGRSSKAPEPRRLDFVEVESRVRLRGLLARLHLARPVLLGHSDGGSIALDYAAAFPDEVAAVIAVAPHVVVEDITREGVAALTDRIRRIGPMQVLAGQHDDPDHAFGEWARVWTDPGIESWSMVDRLATIRCPLLLIQGTADRYGTLRQLDLIADAVSGPVERVVLDGIGHDPFTECPNETIGAVRRFLDAAGS